MRGLSPVIATILLLLFGVVAVGGTWVWFSRQQSTVQTAGEEKISEEIARETAAQIVLAGVYKSGNNLALIISNPSNVDANVTGYKIIKSSGDAIVNTSALISVPSKSSIAYTTVHAVSSLCSSGEKIKIQLFLEGISTPTYVEDCPE